MNYNDEPEIYKRGNILIRVATNKKREKKIIEKQIEEAKNEVEK